jgi:hypothetical protein
MMAGLASATRRDRAGDRVEALFAPQYQTENSPVHKALWAAAGRWGVHAAPAGRGPFTGHGLIAGADAVVPWGSGLIDQGYRGEAECKNFSSEVFEESTIDLFMKTHGGRSVLTSTCSPQTSPISWPRVPVPRSAMCRAVAGFGPILVARDALQPAEGARHPRRCRSQRILAAETWLLGHALRPQVRRPTGRRSPASPVS